MSKVFKNYITRLKSEDIINYKEKLDNIFINKGEYVDSFVPTLYEDKIDHGDMDYFILLNEKGTKEYNKNNNTNDIISFFNNLLNSIGLTIVEPFKGEDGKYIQTIYKTDLEWTMLVEDIENNRFFHLDITILDNAKRFLQYEAYYSKPFLSYHLGIILRNFGIKYTSKGVYYILTKEQTGFEEKKVILTEDLYEFLSVILSEYYIGGIKKISSDFNNINSFEELINFLYNIKLFHYRMFDKDNLKYEEKLKIKSYESNKIINDKIIKDKIDNLSFFYNIDYIKTIKNSKLSLKQWMLENLIEASKKIGNDYYKDIGTSFMRFENRIFVALEEQKYLKKYKERKKIVYDILFPTNEDKKKLGEYYKNKDEEKIGILEILNERIGNLDIEIDTIIKDFNKYF